MTSFYDTDRDDPGEPDPPDRRPPLVGPGSNDTHRRRVIAQAKQALERRRQQDTDKGENR